jgi:hypothetical protein
VRAPTAYCAALPTACSGFPLMPSLADGSPPCSPTLPASRSMTACPLPVDSVGADSHRDVRDSAWRCLLCFLELAQSVGAACHHAKGAHMHIGLGLGLGFLEELAQSVGAASSPLVACPLAKGAHMHIHISPPTSTTFPTSA